MNRLRTLAQMVIEDERGLSGLERFGLFAAVLSILIFIPAVRSVFGEAFDVTLGAVDDEGHLTSTAIALRGIMITIVAIVSFIGTVFLLLYTNLGKRLAFLVTGAAMFGWMCRLPRGAATSTAMG